MPATRWVRGILLTAAPLGLAVHGVGPGNFDWHPPRTGARQPDTPGTRRGVSSAVYGPALADAVGPARGAVRDWRSTGRSGAGPIHTARGSTRRRRPGWVMAGSLALALVLGLAGLSFVMRAVGPFLSNIPAAITQRTTRLAPALLAALVSIQLTGPNGLLHLDVKVPAVILAALLSALRLPLIVCVVAGALLAALLRAVFHL